MNKLLEEVTYDLSVPENAAQMIRELRQRAGLTQEYIAAVTGVSQSTVKGWEKGTQSPSLAEFIQIVNECGGMVVETGAIYDSPRRFVSRYKIGNLRF